MPLYEYECEACGHRFEQIRKFSDPPVEICPKCGGHVRKLMSSPAIQFKGSGWYVTDYAKKDSTPAGKSSDSGSAAKDTSAKTETKSSSTTDSSSSSSTSEGAAAKK